MSEEKKNETSEEKKLANLNVIVEDGGDWRKVINGSLCTVAVVGEESAESYSYGSVNLRDAYAIIHASARQIGAIAANAGIGMEAAKAVACDAIAKHMRSQAAERILGGIDGILADLGDCPDFEPSDGSEES